MVMMINVFVKLFCSSINHKKKTVKFPKPFKRSGIVYFIKIANGFAFCLNIIILNLSLFASHLIIREYASKIFLIDSQVII